MTTSPTEQEIVARVFQKQFGEEVGGCFSPKIDDVCEPPNCYCITYCNKLAKDTISALDSHRAKNAVEVENGLDNLANHLFSLDSGSGEGKLLVQAANLISTLRSAIAEKDEALRPFANTAALIPPDWEDDHSLGEWALCLDVADLRRARSRISDGAK